MKARKFSPEVQERAVRLVQEQKGLHGSEWAAIQSVSWKIGCTSETLRLWLRQHERDAGQREEMTSPEKDRIKQLERENRELKKVNEILRLSSKYFAKAELDRSSRR